MSMKIDENGKFSSSKYLRDHFGITVLAFIANSYVIFN